MTSRPRIAVTMGDPAGVGPEVCLHLLAHETIVKECVPVIFGDAAVLERIENYLGGGSAFAYCQVPLQPVPEPDPAGQPSTA